MKCLFLKYQFIILKLFYLVLYTSSFHWRKKYLYTSFPFHYNTGSTITEKSHWDHHIIFHCTKWGTTNLPEMKKEIQQLRIPIYFIQVSSYRVPYRNLCGNLVFGPEREAHKAWALHQSFCSLSAAVWLSPRGDFCASISHIYQRWQCSLVVNYNLTKI